MCSTEISAGTNNTKYYTTLPVKLHYCIEHAVVITKILTSVCLQRPTKIKNTLQMTSQDNWFASYRDSTSKKKIRLIKGNKVKLKFKISIKHTMKRASLSIAYHTMTVEAITQAQDSVLYNRYVSGAITSLQKQNPWECGKFIWNTVN